MDWALRVTLTATLARQNLTKTLGAPDDERSQFFFISISRIIWVIFPSWWFNSYTSKLYACFGLASLLASALFIYEIYLARALDGLAVHA